MAMIEIHSFRIGNIYMFIQMSLVSVAGDGRDVFFWGGGELQIFWAASLLHGILYTPFFGIIQLVEKL